MRSTRLGVLGVFGTVVPELDRADREQHSVELQRPAVGGGDAVQSGLAAGCRGQDAARLGSCVRGKTVGQKRCHEYRERAGAELVRLHG